MFNGQPPSATDQNNSSQYPSGNMDMQYLPFDPYEPQVPQAREGGAGEGGGDEVDASRALAGLNLSAGQNASSSGPRRVSPKRSLVGLRKDKGSDKPKDMRKSCAECRRLKAKCDRVFPCSNCRRRGCALVCPDGDLSCMQGKRLVLASTEQLHDRIAQLETALFQSHSKLGVGPHPLLAPEFLDGGFASMSGSTPPPPPMGESTAGMSGSSPPSANRRSPSYSLGPGPNVSEEVVAHPDREWVGDRAVPAQYLPTPSMVQGSGHALVAKLSKLLSVLPPREELRRRAKRFWVQSGWYQYILQRDEFERIYEPAVYAPTPLNPLSPHKLACVLMVLVLDCFLDLTRETEDPKVALYWDAVQECFDTRFGWAASVAGVQALGLMSYFVGFGWKGARASNFYWLRRMTTATQQLGMYKDPHPSIPHEEAELRRRVFHESFVIDGLISINHGHRNAIPIENIECRYPAESPRLTVRYDYMRNINNTILDYGLRPDAIAATPEEIRALEEMMAQFDPSRIPQHHCPALSGAPFPDPPANIILDRDLTPSEVLTIAITANSMTVQKTILFLHRPALRRLIHRLRLNPDSEFTEYDNHVATQTFEACRRIRTCAKYFARSQPLLAGRAWTTWTQLFSGAVSMAGVALWCSPHMDPSYLTTAYIELNETRIMIDESGSDRARGIHALVPMLQQAVAARYPHLAGLEEAQINHESEDMIFALLGGAVDQHGPSGMPMADRVAHPPPTYNPASNEQQQYYSNSAPTNSAPTRLNSMSGSSSGEPSINMTPTNDDQPLHDQSFQQPHLMPQNNSDQAQYQQQQHQQHQQQQQYDMAPYLVIPQQQQQQPHSAPPLTTPRSLPLGAGPQQQQPQQQQPEPAGAVLPDGANGTFIPMPAPGPDGNLSPTELWARLQTFYEPTVWWGLGDGNDAVPQHVAAQLATQQETPQQFHPSLVPMPPQQVYPAGAMGMY